MKKGILMVFALIVLFFYTTNITSANSNLVQNGSFEEGAGQAPEFWQAEAWDKNQGITEYKLESGKARSGNKYATIINHGPNDSRFTQQIFVEENKMYRLSCWINAANIPKELKGANISLLSKMETSPDIWDTNGEWRQAVMYVKTGPGINTFTVSVGIGTYSSLNTGAASFDDVVIEETPNIPDGAVVCSITNEPEQSGSENSNHTAPSQYSTVSIFGWILFVSIFVIIIFFILYRSVVKPAPPAEDATDESTPVDSDSVETENDVDKEKENKDSDDLL